MTLRELIKQLLIKGENLDQTVSINILYRDDNNVVQGRRIIQITHLSADATIINGDWID